MKKRGQLIFKALIVIIASAIIVFAFINAGKSYGSQEAFYKLAVAKDLALTIDLMYSLHGDVEFIYPNDVSDYGIEIKGNTVKVYSRESGKLEPTTASYSFAGIGADQINARIEGKNFVRLEKTGDNIKVSGVGK